MGLFDSKPAPPPIRRRAVKKVTDEILTCIIICWINMQMSNGHHHLKFSRETRCMNKRGDIYEARRTHGKSTKCIRDHHIDRSIQ